MINYEALFKLSYGLYLVCAGNKERANGFVSNTFFQVTAEPAQFAACCNKNNFTSEFIIKHSLFSVSVLSQNASTELIGRFGYKSGRDVNKMEGLPLIYGTSGVPIVTNEAVAYLECKVVKTVDVGTHWMFIGELINAELLESTDEPLTYDYYRKVRKAFSPKNAPTYIDKSKLEKPKTPESNRYRCAACGYVYDDGVEAIKFNDLPNDWVCPVCGSEKDDFILVEN